MSSASGPSTRDRAAISLAVGVITFVLMNMIGRNGQALGAGVVLTIVVWLLIGSSEKSEDKNK
jgi:hypothetical protein